MEWWVQREGEREGRKRGRRAREKKGGEKKGKKKKEIEKKRKIERTEAKICYLDGAEISLTSSIN